MSGRHNWLSNEISNNISSLSTRLSVEIDELSANLSGDVDSLSGKLSNEISVLDYHYYRTFEKDVHVGIDEKVGPDISVDLLKLTEETGSGTKYTLHLSAGTLVLMPTE